MTDGIASSLNAYLEHHVSAEARERMLWALLRFDAEDPDVFDGSRSWDSIIGMASVREGIALWSNPGDCARCNQPMTDCATRRTAIGEVHISCVTREIPALG